MMHTDKSVADTFEADIRDSVKSGAWLCPFLMKDGCDQPHGLCYCLRDSRHKPQDARAMEGRDG